MEQAEWVLVALCGASIASRETFVGGLKGAEEGRGWKRKGQREYRERIGWGGWGRYRPENLLPG